MKERILNYVKETDDLINKNFNFINIQIKIKLKSI